MKRIFMALAVMVVASSAQFHSVTWASAAPNAGRGQAQDAPVVQMAAVWMPEAGTQGVG